MESAEAGAKKTCVGCGEEPPRTETPYTLISSTYGWRLTFVTTGNQRIPAWRCPSCWNAFKNHRHQGARAVKV